MREALDDVIALRAVDPRGASRMITWSLIVHAAVVAGAIVAPWLGLMKPKAPVKIMTISLGGVENQKPATPTNIGGRPVEEAVPEPKRPEPIKPVATKPDVMTIPEKAPPKPPKTPPPAKVREEAKAPPPPKVVREAVQAPSPVPQPPTRGRQATPGNSRAETGVTGIGTGLQIGDGVGGRDTPLTDFCCQAYLNEIVRRIEANHWDEHQAERGSVTVRFTVQRSGDVTDLSVFQPGPFLLNRASLVPFRNLHLPPLPTEFKEPSLTLRLEFVYK